MTRQLMFLALLPGLLIIWYVYKKDMVEPEPRGLLLKLILLGACSCIPAAFLEGHIENALPAYAEGSLEYAVTEAFCVAAICEEFCKLVLLRLGSWRNRAFDYRFDGIVYAVCIAVGFALLENILYVADGGISVALTRGVLAVPLHAFCGVFMGIFYGAAKRYSLQGKSVKAFCQMILAFLIPVIIHGIYDTMCFLGTGLTSLLLLIFVAIMYILSIVTVKKYSKEDWKAGFYNYTEPLYTESYAKKNDSATKKTIIACPHCGRLMSIPEGAGNIRITCPYCNEKFVQQV